METLFSILQSLFLHLATLSLVWGVWWGTSSAQPRQVAGTTLSIELEGPALQENFPASRNTSPQRTVKNAWSHTALGDLDWKAPAYPEVARIKGWEGAVTLQFSFSDQGEAEQVKVVQSSGYPVLDDAALSAAQSWKVTPPKEGAIPPMQKTVRFRLSDETSTQ